MIFFEKYKARREFLPSPKNNLILWMRRLGIIERAYTTPEGKSFWSTPQYMITKGYQSEGQRLQCKELYLFAERSEDKEKISELETDFNQLKLIVLKKAAEDQAHSIET